MIKGSFKTRDGTRLVYTDSGKGFPLLALAGFTRNRRDFDYMARHLRDVRLIRLDSRGRGESDWTGADTYTAIQEAHDALELLNHLGLDRVAIIGSSRGGLLGMLMAMNAPDRVAGLCLNDVGPILERPGLERIGMYIGVEPAVSTLEEIAIRMPTVMRGFSNVPELRWEQETTRRYTLTTKGIALPYDPTLAKAYQTALAAPPTDGWPLFDACADMPMALIRGANSDVLSSATADMMQTHHPDMIRVDVPNRGHVPFLDEPESLKAIQLWLERCAGKQGEYIRQKPAMAEAVPATGHGV